MPETLVEAAAPPSPSLLARLRREAELAGGWLSFAGFMNTALYAPHLGYYAGSRRKFGVAGDFVTAPEMTPLFAETLAVQAAQVLAASDRRIIEFGGGSGRLARDLLLALDGLGAAPDEYALLEVSPDLARRQQQLLTESLPARLARRVRWPSELPEHFDGLAIANELLDALPIHLVHWGSGSIDERGVCFADDGQPRWHDRPATGRLLAAAQRLAADHSLPPGYRSEISLAGPAWMRSVGERLRRGAIVVIDYGFPAHEYYHPQRDGGTLMCHHRHRAHPDPLVNVGSQDITAHVDFSAIAEAAHEAGLNVAGYTTQAAFLMNCGILERLAALPPSATDTFRAKAAVQKLLSPAEMGELFKVIALTKHLRLGEQGLVGFTSGDRRCRL
jgi:SAM-dependent MidA family methyltransferase